MNNSLGVPLTFQRIYVDGKGPYYFRVESCIYRYDLLVPTILLVKTPREVETDPGFRGGGVKKKRDG